MGKLPGNTVCPAAAVNGPATRLECGMGKITLMAAG
jgi:hypothetical protein